MGRDLRYIPEGDGLVSITDRCFQSRFLLRPSPALPCWSRLDPAERQTEVLAIVRDIEAQAQERARTTGRPVLGRREVLRQHPHSSPAIETRSPAPRFHAASKRVRQELLRSYYAFLDAYRTAAEALRAGRFAQAHFPPGAIPPPLAPVPLRPG